METNKSDRALYPKELLDINSWNTSEERLKEAYKIFSNTYDQVRIYSIYLLSSTFRVSSEKRWEHEQSGSKWQVERVVKTVVCQSLGYIVELDAYRRLLGLLLMI